MRREWRWFVAGVAVGLILHVRPHGTVMAMVDWFFFGAVAACAALIILCKFLAWWWERPLKR